MSTGKVKIVGYSQAVNYNDSIQYRNFTPDLVGLQLASNGGTPLFTMGNFSITTNMEPKSDKTFITNKFSNFITLSDLNITLSQTQTLLNNNANVILNLDKTNLNYYARFGSLTEFIRVSLEDIIINWPASLYLSPISQTSSGQPLNGFTYDNYLYDNITENSSFRVDTNFINNKFSINYLKNGSIVNTFNATNDIRNLTINYNSYSIFYNGIEYPVIGFTGSTTSTNDYIYLHVSGNPFSGQPTTSKIKYHIKPNKLVEETFYNSLPEFENYLLNRKIIPQYTSIFKYPIKTNTGIVLYITKTFTWPVSDGYNIDFDTTDYLDFATNLLNIATDYDLTSSNLINRFLVSESITSFDTQPVHFSDQDQDMSGQKINKTFQIYGRNFDEINNFIQGIAFSNTVTYDKLDNTPDIYLKTLARVLGWNLISSVAENDLLSSYVTTTKSNYSGYSAGYTAAEADIELWRRIILNTPWIWKSKGARKSIEFILRFIGAPQGLIKFNEYVYKADAPIDLDLFVQALQLNGLSTDLSLYPIDENGYPNPLPNTSTMYFQNYGLWYRETGGSGSTLDTLVGNNPHLGPYDGGYAYIEQFRNLIPNFSAITLTSETITTGTTNLFTNYDLGGITNYTGSTYVDVVSDDGSSLANCVVVSSSIIPDPMPSDYITNCGCASKTDDDSLSVCIDLNEAIINSPCPNMVSLPSSNSTGGVYIFNYYQYNDDGSIYLDVNSNPIPNTTPFASKECCKATGGIPFYITQTYNGNIVNDGYFCCDNSGKCGCTIACGWTASTSTILLPLKGIHFGVKPNQYLSFIKQDGSLGVVTPDGCNCLSKYTIPVPNILDPYTNQIGVGCQLTTLGRQDIALGVNSVIYKTYLARTQGKSSCYNRTIGPNRG